MVRIDSLSKHLQPVLEHELARGNEVAEVQQPAGTTCPLAILLKHSMDFAGIKASLQLDVGVKRWENRDPHYPRESGFFCNRTRHAIAGPPKRR